MFLKECNEVDDQNTLSTQFFANLSSSAYEAVTENGVGEIGYSPAILHISILNSVLVNKWD